jgi:argininosuccinate synthase
MIAYCEQYGIPIKETRQEPYSTDANLLGMTHEAGALEDLETSPTIVTPEMGVWPDAAPDHEEEIEISIEEGRPRLIDGVPMSIENIFHRLNQVAGRNGVGIASNLIENRYVGTKSRGVYEAPGLTILGEAFQKIVELTLDRDARKLYDYLSALLGEKMYRGYYDDTTAMMSRNAMKHLDHRMSGTVMFGLYKGNIVVKAVRDVPYSVYSNDSSMEDEGVFDHKDSEGLLNILKLNARKR